MISDMFIATFMIIGSFFIPYIFTILFWRIVGTTKNISFLHMTKWFFIGGFVSSHTEMLLVMFFIKEGKVYNWNLWTILFVISEEIIKMCITLCIVQMRRKRMNILNGIVIGAAVGSGFAAFETLTYAYSYYNWFGGIEAMFNVIIRRNLLFPGNHIVWTAITGAAVIYCLYLDNKVYSVLLMMSSVIMHAICNFSSENMTYVNLGIVAWIILYVLFGIGKNETAD